MAPKKKTSPRGEEPTVSRRLKRKIDAADEKKKKKKAQTKKTSQRTKPQTRSNQDSETRSSVRNTPVSTPASGSNETIADDLQQKYLAIASQLDGSGREMLTSILNNGKSGAPPTLRSGDEGDLPQRESEEVNDALDGI